MNIKPSVLFHPTLLRSFIAVADERSFSKAAMRLNSLQPTVSHHMARLEAILDRRLLSRGSRGIVLTAAGETLLPIARSIIVSYEMANGLNVGSLKGRIQLGASEDFALARLPPILQNFKHIHEEVDLVVTIASSATLDQKLADRELDLAVVECMTDQRSGYRLRREQLEWFALPQYGPTRLGEMPIVLSTPPSAIRDLTIAALNNAGMPWREACTASSFLGLRAAALAGLGATPLLPIVNAGGLQRVPAGLGFPPLPQIEMVLVVANESPVVMELTRQFFEAYQDDGSLV